LGTTVSCFFVPVSREASNGRREARREEPDLAEHYVESSHH
jgi:hypothetical protein